MKFEDIIYEKRNGIARVTINRPEKHNAFRTETLMEMAEAFECVGNDRTIGVAVLSGADKGQNNRWVYSNNKKPV